MAWRRNVLRLHRGWTFTPVAYRRGCPGRYAAEIEAAASVPLGPVVAVGGEQLPVDLYDGEKERRADAEQQGTVDRFQRTQHPPSGWQRNSRYVECCHGCQ